MRPLAVSLFLGASAWAGTLGAQPITLPGTQPRALHTPLAAAGSCTECHQGLTSPAGNAYLPIDTWQTSMMANATQDPLFLATLTDSNQSVPGIGQFCLRCHSPQAFAAGRADTGTTAMLDPVQGDLDGVHCDGCHRSMDPAAQSPAISIGNAQLVFADALTPAVPSRFGPYAPADVMASPYHPSVVQSAFLRSAQFCGQCHDLDNPLVNRRGADGADLAPAQPFPLQSTFTEWSQSAFSRGMATVSTNQTCQDCHMPAEHGMLAVSQRPGALLHMDPRRHDFYGGNEWGMALMKAARPGELDDQFDAARVRARTFLQGAARVEIMDAPTTAAAGSTVHLSVRVTNLTGHKLPTGYEDARQMWLQVAVGSTNVSGDYLNDALVEDSQLRAYRFVPGHVAPGSAAMAENFLTQHNTVIEDTRIPPEGMMPTPRTAPVGRDYAGGAAGALRNYDLATYSVTVPPATPNGPTALTVRLLYQATTKNYVQDIANANHTDHHGSDLMTDWNAAGRAPPFTVVTATVMVNVTGGGTAVDAGTTDAGAHDGSATVDGSGAHADGAVTDGPDATTVPTGDGAGGTGGTGGCDAAAPVHNGRAPWTTLALLAGVALATRRRR